jgi:hypothetical protein
MNCHLDFLAGTVVDVQSHHATDCWLVGRANGLTGGEHEGCLCTWVTLTDISGSCALFQVQGNGLDFVE